MTYENGFLHREFFIEDFKNGVRNIMVATSVCARGLDIKHLNLVINYTCPSFLEDEDILAPLYEEL